MLKKTALILLCCLMVISNAGVVNAGGVPVFQDTVSVGTAFGTKYATPTDNDWSEHPSSCGEDGCVTYHRYYKVLATSPTYYGTGYYISSYNATLSATRLSTSAGVGVIVQGRNSYSDAWTTLASSSLTSGSSTTVSQSFTLVSQIRIVAVGSDTYLNIGGGRFTGTFNSYGLSLMGADQDTVELARQAAVNASVSAQNTYTACYDEDADKTVIDYVKEIRQAQNANVEITKVQGLGGATCTSISTFTAIVSVNPETGVIITATCTGPSSPSVGVSGNIVTIDGLNSPGAYTATIRATIGTTSSTYSYTFFRI